MINSFIKDVERFCEWVEGNVHTLSEGRQHLLTLMLSLPSIENFRDVESDEAAFSRRRNDGWEGKHGRFQDLPFQYYRSVFDPHDLDSTNEFVMGDLYDDFADIYEDLRCGLQAHLAGWSEDALVYWVNSYFAHWGHHASSALKAIDSFYRVNRNGNE